MNQCIENSSGQHKKPIKNVKEGLREKNKSNYTGSPFLKGHI